MPEMETQTFLVHYGEIGLKGGNRRFFERILEQNIAKALGQLGKMGIRRLPGRLILETPAAVPIAAIQDRLRETFGIVSFAIAVASRPDIAALKETAWRLTQAKSFASFKVEAHRASKNLPFTSQILNSEIGAHLQRQSGARVDLEHPDLTVFLEVADHWAYLYAEKLRGPGGLPVGTAGRLLALLSGGIDSPVAAWKMLKRGCRIDFLHFHSHPLTSPASIEKVRELATTLDRFQFAHRLFLAPFARVQTVIVKKIPEPLRVIFYRMVMLRCAAKLAKKEGYLGLVTGESVGQVASQTLENILATSTKIDLPVYRPLAGDDKEEIITLARRIGTFEISIRPHEDCCTLFLPRRPETRATIREIAPYRKRLKISSLADRLLRSTTML